MVSTPPEDERLERIEAVLDPVLRDHGLDLVDLEWRPVRPRAMLRVFVDKRGGVAIADCERFSREAGDVLDAEGLIPEAYDLEVSSPGLERQLRTEREYRWAVGKRVCCWLAGGQEVHGRLAEVHPERLVVEQREERVEIARARVTKARLEAEVPWPRRS